MSVERSKPKSCNFQRGLANDKRVEFPYGKWHESLDHCTDESNSHHADILRIFRIAF
jgi:hypothetical protein